MAHQAAGQDRRRLTPFGSQLGPARAAHSHEVRPRRPCVGSGHCCPADLREGLPRPAEQAPLTVLRQACWALLKAAQGPAPPHEQGYPLQAQDQLQHRKQTTLLKGALACLSRERQHQQVPLAAHCLHVRLHRATRVKVTGPHALGLSSPRLKSPRDKQSGQPQQAGSAEY